MCSHSAFPHCWVSDAPDMSAKTVLLPASGVGLPGAPSYTCICLLEREKDAKKVDLLCPHCWRSFLCVYQLVAIGYNGPVESGGVVERLQATLHSALLFCPVLCFSRLICFLCTRNWPSFCLNVSILLVLIPWLCCSAGFITLLSEKLPLREKKGSGGTCTMWRSALLPGRANCLGFPFQDTLAPEEWKKWGKTEQTPSE